MAVIVIRVTVARVTVIRVAVIRVAVVIGMFVGVFAMAFVGKRGRIDDGGGKDGGGKEPEP
jgi:hypothetical protein